MANRYRRREEDRSSSELWDRLTKPVTLIIGIIGLTVAVASLTYVLTKDRFQNRIDELGRQIRTAGPPTGQGFIVSSMLGKTTDFGEDLKITVTGLLKKSNPERYVVNAKVQHRGLADMKIGAAEVGYVVTYPQEDGYQIEIVKADAQAATFSIQSHKTAQQN